jgi:hypothetical protein
MRRKSVLPHLVNNGVDTPSHPHYSGANSSTLSCALLLSWTRRTPR